MKRITAGAPRDMMAIPSSNLRPGCSYSIKQRVCKQPRCILQVSLTQHSCGQLVWQVNVRQQPLARLVAVHRELVEEGCAVRHLRASEARNRERCSVPGSQKELSDTQCVPATAGTGAGGRRQAPRPRGAGCQNTWLGSLPARRSSCLLLSLGEPPAAGCEVSMVVLAVRRAHCRALPACLPAAAR